MTERAPKRWLKLAAVAKLMGIEHPSAHYRAKYVRRLLMRLEQRDGTAYLRRFGGPGSAWHVSPGALEQLEPHSPNALGRMRQDINTLASEMGAIRRQIGAHGGRIRELEKNRTAAVASVAKVKSQSGTIGDRSGTRTVPAITHADATYRART